MNTPAPNIGDLLLAEGHITPDDLRRALALKQQQPHVRLGTLLVALGVVDQRTVNESLDKQLTIRRGGLPPLKTTLAIARHAVRSLSNTRRG